MKPLQEFWQHFKLLPSSWLLLVQLLMLVITPMFNSMPAGNAVSWILSVLALLVVGRIIHSSAVYTMIGVICVVPALILSIIIYFGHGSPHIVITANILEAIAYLCAAYGLTRYMFADRYLTRDELFAAACVFTLMVWGFAFLYSACQVWDRESFVGVSSDHTKAWLRLIFLSFSVQSGTGLSDILPHTDFARILVAFQMFAGVMYLTLIVSRLIALQYIRHVPKSKDSEE